MRPFMRVLAVVGLTFMALAVFAPQMLVWGQAGSQDLIINYVAPPVPNQAAQNNEVRAYFSVLNAGRQQVLGLTKDAFGVSLFGQPITAFDLSQPKDPMAIILVIDTSGSMSGEPLKQAIAAAKQFIDTLGDQDEVAVFSFNQKGSVTNHTQGFKSTQNKGAININNLIGALVVPTEDGWTCLYNALYDAVTLAVKRPQDRGAIVVLSDGADIGADKKQCSTHNVGDVVDKAQTTRLPIYAIGLGQADQTTLDKFAAGTGGQALVSPKPTDLTQKFADIGHLLKDQYRLVFTTDQSGSGALQISLNSDPKAVDAEQITLLTPPPPPTSIPQPPAVDFEGRYQSASNAFVFTVTLRSNPASNAKITDARWYVDNGQQGVISDTQAPAVLVYNVVDSAGTCRLKPNPHELRIEVTDEKGLKGEKSGTFAIAEDMCPITPPPPSVLPYLIGIAGVALLALAGVVFIMRRQSKATVVYGENLSDKTEEAPSEVGLVARLRLMGGSQTADGKTELTMTTDTFRIGRDTDSELCLAEKKVSRKHAEIHFNPVTRTFTLFDRNSTGGTRVNDKFIKAGSEVLTNNATIVVGSANILFEVVRGGELTGDSTGSATEDDDRTEMERP